MEWIDHNFWTFLILMITGFVTFVVGGFVIVGLYNKPKIGLPIAIVGQITTAISSILFLISAAINVIQYLNT